MSQAVGQREDEQTRDIPEGLQETLPKQDLIEFKQFAIPIAKSISHNLQNNMHKTIGVYGEWGSGKTTFLWMVDQCLRDERIIPVWFDAWKYDKEDNLWSALIQKILDQATVYGTWYQRAWVKVMLWRDTMSFRAGLWEFLKKLIPFLLRLALILLGVILFMGLDNNTLRTWLPTHTTLPTFLQAPLVKAVGAFAVVVATGTGVFSLINLLKDSKLGVDYSKFSRKPSYREHIAFLDEFTKEFEHIVRRIGRGKPLVVMIDDLDRCLPGKAIQIIEAIKNILDVKGCIFLLGLDRTIVEQAVAVKYKDLIAIENNATNEAIRKTQIFRQDYMDKIIQISILVPRLQSTQEIENFVRDVCNDEDIKKYSSIFAAGLSPNPRKIKRVLRAFLFMRDVVEENIRAKKIQQDDIKLSVLAKLIVIRNLLPEVYRRLNEQPSLLEDLETYYFKRKQLIEQMPQKASLQEEEEDQSISKQAESYSQDHPELRWLLLKEIENGATFQKADMQKYMKLIASLVDIEHVLMEKRAPTEEIAAVGLPATPEKGRPIADEISSGEPPKFSDGKGTSSPAQSIIWNIPFRRNPYLTGREAVLDFIHDRLTSKSSVALTQPLAISGLGGIGKTQLAVEYAYRYRDLYNHMLWIDGSYSEAFIAGIINLAKLLDLEEQNATDSSITLNVVRRWLQTHAGWLLIIDNVEEPLLVTELLPSAIGGHVLLTSRISTLGPVAQTIVLDTLGSEEGALLLLRRSRVIAPDAPLTEASTTDYETAKKIVEALGSLPLAIDQAGAYIEETGCSLTDYLRTFQTRHADLLKFRSRSTSSHPESIATTWSLAFDKIEKANPPSADLLRFCAFLNPDDIPEELFIKGAPELSPGIKTITTDPFMLDEAIATLLTYSLVRRNREFKSISIHPLVQAVLKDSMDEDTQHQWAERVVLAMLQAFPENISDVCPECQRYLPHALVCVALIDQYDLTFRQAADLLDRVGTYLRKRAQYINAEPLLKRALAICEKTLGPEHPDTATSLNDLASLYQAQGRYEEAEPLYQRALSICEKTLGPEHPDTATSLNGLASLYQAQGHYEEAKSLYERALAIREKTLGPEHPDTATSLNDLASLYQAQGRYEEAEPLYQRALSICEKTLGPEHPDLATSLNGLASLYQAQDSYEEAEPFYRRALAIWEQQLGPNHPDTAQSLNDLASLYQAQGRYEEAEPLYQRALSICEKTLGPEHPDTATSLNGLASLYQAQGHYEEAKSLYERALAIREKTLGPEHPDLATSLYNLAQLYLTSKKRKDVVVATELLHRSMTIRTKVFGPQHPDTANAVKQYEALRGNRKQREGLSAYMEAGSEKM